MSALTSFVITILGWTDDDYQLWSPPCPTTTNIVSYDTHKSEPS